MRYYVTVICKTTYCANNYFYQ